ncbi:MAG: hypothetical protein M3Z33_01780, partial [Actinomycetota bacterium]|nr:hypothetical protein [Actinomycetota bacterium]
MPGGLARAGAAALASEADDDGLEEAVGEASVSNSVAGAGAGAAGVDAGAGPDVAGDGALGDCDRAWASSPPSMAVRATAWEALNPR